MTYSKWNLIQSFLVYSTFLSLYFPPLYSPFKPPMGIQFTYEIPIKMLIKVILNLYMQNLGSVLDRLFYLVSPLNDNIFKDKIEILHAAFQARSSIDMFQTNLSGMHFTPHSHIHIIKFNSPL